MKQTTTTLDTRFFRAGVGTVIYNQQNEVFLFKRAKYPVGVWQFQQGGIDLNESTEETLWRELREEVGLEKADFIKVTEMPNWTIYPTADSLADASKSRIGQAHKWYFLELKPDVEIDLEKALDDEASDFRFDTFAGAINETEELKKHVYRELEKFFLEQIVD